MGRKNPNKFDYYMSIYRRAEFKFPLLFIQGGLTQRASNKYCILTYLILSRY